MKIGLNLLHARPEIGGVWNYISRLISTLGDYDDKNEYTAFVTSKSKSIVPNKLNFQVVKVNIPSVQTYRVIYENSILQYWARLYDLDLMHWFANVHALINLVPSIVTVYDLLVYEKNDYFGIMHKIYLKYMMAYTYKTCKHLLPMSNITAQKINHILDVPYTQMVVIPAIIDEIFQPKPVIDVKNFRIKYKLPDIFWLYVAHFYPHKNHLRLLKSYYYLKSNEFSPWPLVLRGDDHGSLQEIKRAIVSLGLEKNVHWLPQLDEIEMPILFSTANGLIFPSLYEGGGIPVLEAMACGCPVIASDIPAVRESGGNAVSLFDPLDVLSISDSIKKFQGNNTDQLKAAQRGLDIVKSHRPRVIAKKIINAYSNCSPRRQGV